MSIIFTPEPTTPEQREAVRHAFAVFAGTETRRKAEPQEEEMSDKAQPFTKAERAEEVSLAIAAEGMSPMSREGERRSRILDYEATLLQVEAKLGTYRYAVEAFLGDETAEVCIERHERLSREATDMGEYERHGMIAAALRNVAALTAAKG